MKLLPGSYPLRVLPAQGRSKIYLEAEALVFPSAKGELQEF